jgi:hypothetical protein
MTFWPSRSPYDRSSKRRRDGGSVRLAK